MNTVANTATRNRLAYWLLGLGLGLLSLLAVAWSSNAFWDALSPVTHKKALYRLAGRYRVDPLMLAAIIKAESSFFPYAESRQGALGLMQLMPATAEQLAQELKLNYHDAEDLYEPATNLRLGAFYYSKLLKSFDGNVVLALAAYNAGPNKLRSWNLKVYGIEQDELIASIPVPETREYVRRVLRSHRIFRLVREVKRLLRGDSEL